MPDKQAAVLAGIEGAAIDGRLRVLRIRQKLFRSLHSVLVQRRDSALQAIQTDDECSMEEAQIVYGSALIELRNHYDALDFAADFEQEYRLAKRKSNEGRRTPIAIAYIIPDTLAMFYSVLSALCAALEAGSCVVIELENTVKKTPILLQQIINDSHDKDVFGIISSRAPVDFLSKCIVVDQSRTFAASSIPKRVLSSPICRNVAVVDRTGDVKLAAREIVASRLAFGGVSRYAVDLVLVNEFVAETFTAAVVQQLENIRAASKDAKALSRSSERRAFVTTTEITLLNEEIESGSVELISGDSSLGLVQIITRTSQLTSRKISRSRVVVFNTITSLDDSIDLLSTETQQTTPVGALYLFSAAHEAKYLSQYIVSQVSYVNHIPAQLSVGPMTPLHYPTNLRCRYTRDMFEMPSPQIVPGPQTHLASTIFKKAAFIDAISRKPLKPTGQIPSGAWGFFEQGMVLGALVYLLPIVGMITFGVGYAAWTGYRRLSE